ncbi:MAG: hypothetical protein R6U98_28420 [Pirellulaceae bacterium]
MPRAVRNRIHAWLPAVTRSGGKDAPPAPAAACRDSRRKRPLPRGMSPARLGCCLVLLAVGFMLSSRLVQAAEPKAREERILFVPLGDLPVILNGPNERVFMTRDEYRALEAKARQEPPARAPEATVLLDAAYDVRIEDNLATLRGHIDLEVLEPGLHMVPLNFQGVTLRGASLDQRPAPIGRDASGQPVLFARTTGYHRLDLELQAPVAVTAARQSLQFQLPTAGSTTMNLAVPGNVEVKSGAAVARRTYDEAADETRFELLPDSEVMDLVMSLNNRRLRQERVVVTRSVLVSELTSSYERLHITAEMRVVHGAVDRFLFDVPQGVQVTEVTSPLMAEWVVREEADGNILDVSLREPTRTTETLNISANRTPVKLGQWTMPRLKPRDVAGYVAVVGLIAEARLQPLNLTAENLIRLDTRVLREGLPASVFDAEPGAPAIRPIAAYYAPGDDFKCSAALEDPQDELRVATHLLLSLEAPKQALQGGFTLTPQASKLTTFAFKMPADWKLDQLHVGDHKPLPFDHYRTDGQARYVVKLPETIEPGKSRTMFFAATRHSSEWLTQWDSRKIRFPRVVVEDATESSGAIAVQTHGDLRATPVNTEKLVPLDAKERGRFGLADSSSELTYQVTGDQYQAEFLIQRKQPKISTRNYSFFQIKDGMLLAHHEVVFQIERAHANQLELTLPDSTPTSLSIHGLDGLQLKEYSHATREGRHHWTVRPAKPLKGMVHLGIDYVQRLDDPEPDELALPLVRAAKVAYQTQMVSIEGNPALDVDLRTNMRPVDVGELVEADYAPGARLLGTFASTTGDETVRVGITRRELRPLPSAIVKRAELVTLLANSGISQSSARYLLRTKVPYLALELPRETELWSVTLDQKPIKPRRRGNQVLLGLQSEESTGERDLRVVYQTPIQTLNWLGRVRARAPRLRLLSDEQDQGTLVPQVDLVWHVVLPTGYTVSRERGTVFSSQLDHPKSPLQRLAKATAIAGGGAHGPPFMLARRARQARRTMAAAGDEGAASARSEPPGRDAPRALTPQMESNQAQQSQAAGTELGQLAGADNERRDEATATTDEPVETSSEPRLVDESNAMSLGEKPAAGPGEGREHQDGDRTGKPRDNASGSGPYGSASGYEQSEGGMGGGMGGMGGGMEGGPPPQGQRSPGQSAQPMGQRAPPRKPRSGEAPATDPGQPDIKTGKYWALQGLRGLPITIDRPDQEIGWLMGEERTFRSLGSEPLLDITVFRNTRMQWLALSVALAVVVWGLLLMARPVASRIRFVVLVAIVSCGLPVLGGPTTEFVLVFEHALLAALALIPIWVILSAVTRSIRWLIGRSSRATIAATSAVLLAGLSVAGFGSTAEAQQEELKTGLETLLQREQPIRIPDDAVVIPYDPEDARWRSHATRVLVPYTRYVELWNQAHPGRKMGEETSQPTFSLAGAKYQATLEDEEHILLDGTVDIEVFSDQPVDVPLALNNAVITSAVLDGEPARLKTIVPRPGAGETQQQQARPKNAAPRAPAMLSLLVEGEGHHRLELTIRIAVDRQGGWRRARATIPHAEATAVELKVLEPGTTIRYPLKKTVLTETIDAAGQVLPLTLRENGLWDVTWRAQVSPGSSDQALTATSAALVDVREDGLRVVWQVELNFGQTERGVFRLDVPSDYLVEDVEGSNVRGWDSSRDGDRTLLNVELLKAVKQQETITLHLSRRASLISRTRPGANGSAGRESDPRENGPRGAPAQPEDSSRDRYGTTFTTPVVSVPDAALHRGTVQIRRSPILELRTLDATGVSRTEGEGVTRKLAPMVGDQESPLEARGYQAYQFSATPFTVRISASRIQPAVEARLRTIVRIGETESTLESEIRLSTQQRDIYVVGSPFPTRSESNRSRPVG